MADTANMDYEDITRALTEMDDGQLEALRSKVSSLQDRRLEEQVFKDAEARRWAAEERESKSGDGSGHVRWEMVRCNDCPRCKAGIKPHGPYLYRYFWKDGKLKSKYLGKKISSGEATERYPEGTTPESLDPAGVARAQADVARQWAEIQGEESEDANATAPEASSPGVALQ
jgi:hypothetical protein